MPRYKYKFSTRIVLDSMEKFKSAAIFLPPELEEKLPLDKHPRLRVEAKIEEVEHHGAFQPRGGRWFMMISKRLRKELKRDVGDTVQVRFNVADQNAVNLPPELEAALAEADADTLAAWGKVTPGKKRGLAHHVNTAKMPETRERRAREVLEGLAPVSFPTLEKKRRAKPPK